MNVHGVHYIRTLPFAKRLAYAQTIRTLDPYVPLVLTASIWFDNEYTCLIVHRHQPLRQLLATLDLPSQGICAVDAISRKNLNLDIRVQDLCERDDLTRYVHVILF